MGKVNERLTELRQMGDAELIGRLGEVRRELFNLRFQRAAGSLDNYAHLSEVRKEVARIETLLREREIALFEAQEMTS